MPRKKKELVEENQITPDKIDATTPAEHVIIRHVGPHGGWSEIVAYFDSYVKFMEFMTSSKVSEPPLTGKIQAKTVDPITEELIYFSEIGNFEVHNHYEYLEMISETIIRYTNTLESSLEMTRFLTSLPEELMLKITTDIADYYKRVENSG